MSASTSESASSSTAAAPNLKTSSATPSDDGRGAGDEVKEEQRTFECNICLDTARDAVVSMCGHLFCWPCLHQWLETRPNRQVCPVCKAAINREKVVPLYGRGSTNQQDPREKFPPRPPGQRTEPESGSHFNGFGLGDNAFHLSFGIGAFPFGFFTSTFNLGDNRNGGAGGGANGVGGAAGGGTPGGAQQLEEQFLSKVFLWLAILFISWLLLA